MTQPILVAIRSFGDLSACSNGVSIELRDTDAYKCGRNIMHRIGMHRELHSNYALHQPHFQRIPRILSEGYNISTEKVNQRCSEKGFDFRIISSDQWPYFHGVIRVEDFVTVVLEVLHEQQNSAS